MQKKKILIIGGSRFSGKLCMYKLANMGHEITVLNRGKNQIEYPSNVSQINVDRMDSDKMISILHDKQFDWIVDYIAWQGPETQVLIDLFEGKIEHFVHISTGNYYNLENLDSFYSQPIFETDGMGPITDDTDSYSKGKRLIEQDLFNAFQKTRFPMTILRPTFIYGPDNYFERESYFFKRGIVNRPILMPSPGYGYIDFIHAEDLADLVILALQNKKAIGEAYNASCGEVICGEQLVSLVDSWEKHVASTEINYYTDANLKEMSWPEDKTLYPFTASKLLMFSPRKAISELGFHPRRLISGLHQTYEWYKNHLSPDEISKLKWDEEDKLINIVKEK